MTLEFFSGLQSTLFNYLTKSLCPLLHQPQTLESNPTFPLSLWLCLKLLNWLTRSLKFGQTLHTCRTRMAQSQNESTLSWMPSWARVNVVTKSQQMYGWPLCARLCACLDISPKWNCVQTLQKPFAWDCKPRPSVSSCKQITCIHVWCTYTCCCSPWVQWSIQSVHWIIKTLKSKITPTNTNYIYISDNNGH